MYTLHNSPHIRRGRTAQRCMLHVIIALLPTTACAIWLFGLSALTVTLCGVAFCVAAEWVIARFVMGDAKKASLTAAALTGLLLALNLPPATPVWALAIGCLVAIGIGKMAFGGLGCNIFNPALVGRVFMLISFPALMTTFTLPDGSFITDGATGATVLTALKEGSWADGAFQPVDLLIGNRAGSIGEVASIALIIGFLYLLAAKVITWHIPISILATVAVFDLCLDIPVGLDILSGGLLLGAIFMATDYVTSPMTRGGMVVYGVMIGVITVVIRRWGAYPEGTSFAILIMNGCTPLINRYMRPRRFGYRKEVAAQ